MSEKEEKKDATERKEDAKQTLKDLIHITSPDDDHDEDDDHEDFVDMDEDSDRVKPNNPVLKTMDEITTSMRGNFERHVVPKVDEFVSNTQYLLDTHVAPKLKEAQENTGKAFKGAQEHTGRVLKDVQTHSTRAVQGVQENTKKAFENADRSTKEFHSKHVQPKIEKAQQDIEEFHAKKVKPHVDKAVSESTRALQETTGCLSKSWHGTKDYIVAHKPYYWNTAPRLFDNTDTSPWYLQLEEATCRSFARVVFCDNPLTGIFVFLGVLMASPLAGLCSFTSVVMVRRTRLVMWTCAMHLTYHASPFINTDQLDGTVLGHGPQDVVPWMVRLQFRVGGYGFGGLFFFCRHCSPWWRMACPSLLEHFVGTHDPFDAVVVATQGAFFNNAMSLVAVQHHDGDCLAECQSVGLDHDYGGGYCPREHDGSIFGNCNQVLWIPSRLEWNRTHLFGRRRGSRSTHFDRSLRLQSYLGLVSDWWDLCG
jgi:hypothetical protein